MEVENKIESVTTNKLPLQIQKTVNEVKLEFRCKHSRGAPIRTDHTQKAQSHEGRINSSLLREG